MVNHPDAAAVTDRHAIEFVSAQSDVVLEFCALGGLIVLRVSASIHAWLKAPFQLQNAIQNIYHAIFLAFFLYE